MRHSTLRTALLTALATLAAGAAAQDAAPSAGLQCDADGCRADAGTLFTTRPSPASATQAPQPAQVQAEPEGASRQTLDLPGGGRVWITEDPALVPPSLDVQGAATASVRDGRLAEPLRFHVRANYAAFIDRLVVRVHRASDTDRIAPIAVVDMPVGASTSAEWDGLLPDGERLEPGETLHYIVRAYGIGLAFDETHARTLQLVTPEEQARLAHARPGAGPTLGASLQAEAERMRAIGARQDANGLRVQNIPVNGSRVRIHGRDLPEGAALSIDGEAVPVDAQRAFVAEYLEPIGRHRYDIRLGDAPAGALEVDVTGRYMALVALADVTVSRTSASPGLEPVTTEDGFADRVLGEGRLAFYLKGKIRGRYLLTAQADTREREVRALFDGFLDAYPQDVFRRLDPDLYYPVYGDDSTTWRDVDTQGRFYVRLDWDRNRLLWGNFNAQLGASEFGHYQRSLYGAALDWRSRAATPTGDPRTQLKAFGSRAQTAPGHSEFIGTGGSLYYLRHTDVLPGSDQVALEVRDRTTGRVEARVSLQRGVDYEIDELQGRIVLTRPLAQLTRENVRTLTRESAFDGFEQRLLVDYEYVPQGGLDGDTVAGLRAEHWLGDHVGLGATGVEERRGGEDYRLAGADVTLRAGQGTYLKLEQSRSRATAAPVFFSDNGGLSFLRRDPVGLAREGEARSVEARANFRELGWTARDWTAGAWWRDVDAGFSISRFDTAQAVEEYGAEFLGRLSDTLGLYGRYSHAARGAERFEQAQLTGEWQPREAVRWGLEVRHLRDGAGRGQADHTLAAVSHHRRVSSFLELYGIGQASLAHAVGERRNDRLTLGARALFGERGSVGAEVSGGTRGEAVQLEAETRLGADHSVYGRYRYSTDSTARESLFDSARQDGWTLGQRWRVSDQVTVFNEHQALKDPYEASSGLAHTFGLDFAPAPAWTFGATVMDAELDTAAGAVQRRAYSLSGGRTDARTQWSSRLEYRRDTGAEQRDQWVSSNRFAHRLSDDWRIAGRAQYARTRDALDAAAGAELAEANIGFAWRPHDGTRWALFGRYTYLYDLASAGQLGGASYDQRTRVLAFEGVYRLDARWEFGGKLALRQGDYRLGRGAGPWFDSRADFAALQARYRLGGQWDGLIEHRWLAVPGAGDRRGWLLGIDRQLGANFRIGAGYNFTGFSDDLTRVREDQHGWFLNFTGAY